MLKNDESQLFLTDLIASVLSFPELLLAAGSKKEGQYFFGYLAKKTELYKRELGTGL
jgi:hypothetical protein